MDAQAQADWLNAKIFEDYLSVEQQPTDLMQSFLMVDAPPKPPKHRDYDSLSFDVAETVDITTTLNKARLAKRKSKKHTEGVSVIFKETPPQLAQLEVAANGSYEILTPAEVASSRVVRQKSVVKGLYSDDLDTRKAELAGALKEVPEFSEWLKVEQPGVLDPIMAEVLDHNARYSKDKYAKQRISPDEVQRNFDERCREFLSAHQAQHGAAAGL